MRLSIAFLFVSSFFVLYPYIFYPLILRLLKKKRIALSENKSASVTMLFCAYNEEASIEKKIANIELLKKAVPDLEIIAYDDGSSDRTLEILAERADLINTVRGEGRCGKAHGMKIISKMATGEILVFSDANVIFDEMAICNLMKYYSDESIGGVCGTLKYVNDDDSATSKTGSVYWKVEEYIKGLESETGNVMGADGSIFSIRKKYYPDFPDTVLDDLTVSMEVVFSGARLIKAVDVLAYENGVSKRSEEFARKVRIAARAYHTHLYLKNKLKKMELVDRFKYLSRKWIRWHGALFVLLAVASYLYAVALLSISAFAFSVFLITGFLYVGYVSQHGIIAAIFEVLYAMFATMLGVLKAKKGVVMPTWNPAKSR